MIWTIIAIAIAAWIGQLILGLYQMRRFTRRVRELKAQYGKIAIGKAKGGLRAGCILLLAIDSTYRITYGEILEGVTVFSRYKPFPILTGENLLELEETSLSHLPKQQRIAALSAKEDLVKFLEMSN